MPDTRHTPTDGVPWRWFVTDLSQPDPWGAISPQFGPFETRADAEMFAEMRDSYWTRRSEQAVVYRDAPGYRTEWDS